MKPAMRLLYLACCAAFAQGRLKSKRGFPPIGTGAVPSVLGPFGVVTGLDPFYPQQYLRDVTDDARQEYFAILKHTNRTIAEHKEEVMRWATKYLLGEKLEEFNKNEEKLKEKLREEMFNLLEELPSVYEDFNEIVDNEEQTHQERRQALVQLKKEYSEAFAVIKFAVDLLSTGGRRHRNTNARPGMEFYRRNKAVLVQRRLKGTKMPKKMEETDNFEEISNGSLIMQGAEHHDKRFRKHTLVI